MSGYVLVGRETEGNKDPDPVGVADLNDDDCRAITGVMGTKKGIRVRGIAQMDFINLKELGLAEWTSRQIIGSDPEPEADYND